MTMGAIILLCGRCRLLHRGVNGGHRSRPAFLSSHMLFYIMICQIAREIDAVRSPPRFLYSKRCRISEGGSAAAAAFWTTKNQPIREMYMGRPPGLFHLSS